ncbi:hypothetical protein [Streptomyces avidinii]
MQANRIGQDGTPGRHPFARGGAYAGRGVFTRAGGERLAGDDEQYARLEA